MKTYFESKPKQSTLSKDKNEIGKDVLDCGLYFEETMGPFRKMACEGVWDDLDRRSRDERLRKGGTYSSRRNRTKAVEGHGR